MIQFTQASGALTVAGQERKMVVTWKKLTPEQIERYRAQKRAYMAVYRAEKAENVRESKKRWADENRPYLRAKWHERQHRGDHAEPVVLPPTQAASRRVKMTTEERERRRVEKQRAMSLPYTRRAYIQNHPDRRNLESRVLACVQAAIPARLGRDLRDELTSMLFEAIYTGRFPIKVKEAHALQLMREYHRMFTNFGPVSLDEVVGEGGYTRGQSLGVF